jgi:hypothetical protein
MTHYGNSWMMRRYHWNWWLNNSGLEDDEEYLKAITAKNYYLEARKHAKTREFQILCMAMAARCENYRLEKIVQDKGYDYPDSLRTKIIETNRYKAILVQDYCDDYEILRGNCESFDTYFAMR